MLAVFEKAITRHPETLNVHPTIGVPKTRPEMAERYRTDFFGTTFYRFANGNFMALPHPTRQVEAPPNPRSAAVVDDIFCIFIGSLDNICEMRRHYGLTRHATESTLVIEMYKALRDRAPYPVDQAFKDLEGNYAFVLFDAKTTTLFIAKDRDYGMPLYWGQAYDGSLAVSDFSEAVLELCGVAASYFPSGCIFSNKGGLVSYVYPLNKVMGTVSFDRFGKVEGIHFDVDHLTRLPSIPRVGSGPDWSSTATPPTPHWSSIAAAPPPTCGRL